MVKHWLIPSLLSLALNPVVAMEPPDKQRLDTVAERGRQVMPFDLEKTLHVFSLTREGGRQEVIARDPADTEQITLIRTHLAQIANAYAKGDFSGPARIHGDDMPGLAAMRSAAPGMIEYRYQELANGARIDYVSQDAALIDAIHRYFGAQLSDHARHAVPGHDRHGMHRP